MRSSGSSIMRRSQKPPSGWAVTVSNAGVRENDVASLERLAELPHGNPGGVSQRPPMSSDIAASIAVCRASGSMSQPLARLPVQFTPT